MCTWIASVKQQNAQEMEGACTESTFEDFLMLSYNRNGKYLKCWH